METLMKLCGRTCKQIRKHLPMIHVHFRNMQRRFLHVLLVMNENSNLSSHSSHSFFKLWKICWWKTTRSTWRSNECKVKITPSESHLQSRLISLLSLVEINLIQATTLKSTLFNIRVPHNSLATDKPVALKLPIKLEFRGAGFSGGRKTGEYREKPSHQGWDHIGGKQVLSPLSMLLQYNNLYKFQ